MIDEKRLAEIENELSCRSDDEEGRMIAVSRHVHDLVVEVRRLRAWLTEIEVWGRTAERIGEPQAVATHALTGDPAA